MSLRTVATFNLGETKNGGSDETCVVLNIAHGSVIRFEVPSSEITSGKQKVAPSSKIGSNQSKNDSEEEKTDAQTDLKKDETKPADEASEERKTDAQTDLEKDETKPANEASKEEKSDAPKESEKDETKPADEASKENSKVRVGAIVNAANERCLGGGGVDLAINNAGGYRLMKDRQALPILSEQEVRCHTGSAVITGPNRYGSLRVNYVVHAVGPAYFLFSNEMSDEDSDEGSTDMEDDESGVFTEPDALLRSAYQESLERCRENGITDVAFSLLSAGIFRGKRTLNEVLFIGITAIRDWVDEQNKMDLEAATNDSTGDEPSPPHRLRSVTLCGFSSVEVVALYTVCCQIFGNKDSTEE